MENNGLTEGQHAADHQPPLYQVIADQFSDAARSIGSTVADSASRFATTLSDIASSTAALVERGLLPDVSLDFDGEPEEQELSPETQQARTRLEAAAREHISDPAARQRFLDDLNTFTARDLPDSEIRATLDTVTELLQAGDSAGGQSRERRELAARGIIYNAAHPGTLAQIGGTCGAASIERILYQDQPSLAASMVSSIVRTGQFTGRDGVRIDVPVCNLTPAEAQQSVPPRNPRMGPSSALATYASQVFLAGMFNEIGQHLDPPRRYERNGDTEEWVSGDGTRVNIMAGGTTGTNGELSMTGGLPSALVVSGLRRLTGRDHSVILNPNFDADRIPTAERPITGASADGIQQVTSAQELQTLLSRLSERGELPAVVSISNQALFDLAFPPRPPRPGDPPTPPAVYTPDHFVTVHAYRPGPPPVADIRNSWGNDPRFNRTLTIEQLFGALGNRRPQARP